MQTSPVRYTLTAIVLHWALAALIVVLIGIGSYMTELPRNASKRSTLVSLHQALGLTAALLIVIRVYWSLAHAAPPLPVALPAWQIRATQMGHRLLYLCMILMPLTGYLGSSFGKHAIQLFGFDLPHWGWEDKFLQALLMDIHSAIAFVFFALIVLHIAAALKHHLLDRNDVFRRMLP